jgi:hypothetical protein
MARARDTLIIGRSVGFALMVLALRAALDPGWPIPADQIEAARARMAQERAEASVGWDRLVTGRPGSVVVEPEPSDPAVWRIRWTGPSGTAAPSSPCTWRVVVYDADYLPLAASVPVGGSPAFVPIAELETFGARPPAWVRLEAVGCDGEFGSAMTRWPTGRHVRGTRAATAPLRVPDPSPR